MKKLLLWYSGLNIYLKLTPFLFFYLIICAAFAPHDFVLDEKRYITYAHELLRGFYSLPAPNISLWSGRGYSVLILPFVFLKLPLMAIRLLNGFLLYFSLIIIYKSINNYASSKIALIYTIILGLYFPVFEKLPLTETECFTWFLISAICYLFIKNFRQKNINWKLIILCGFTIAYLAMTKIIFGYVILGMLFFSILIFVFPKLRLAAKKSTYIFAIAMLFCLPYLIYTYSLTKKVFYWSDSGSMSLYDMSAPYPNDSGDWKDYSQMQENPNYKPFADSILKLTPSERDKAYKEKAVANIKKYPKKYLMNWVANVGRLLFSYPFTNMFEDAKTYFTIGPNMFVVVFMVITIVLSAFHYKRLPQELIILLFFILIYLAGSSLVSAFRRMFYITMPFWTLFFAYVLTNIVSIKIKRD